jgi:hypothetical protein
VEQIDDHGGGGFVLMDSHSFPIEAAKPPATTESPHHVFILPALIPPRLDDITILILTDGNRRSSPGGGYACGARQVVSIAEHLARRPDVAAMVACVLSPDNIAKRGDGFFFELYEAFIDLGVAITTRGALVSANIRMEPWGDLGLLRARGGYALALADAVEAVARMTSSVADPDLRLLLGVGYGPDTALELDVDLILRTGMEEPGVLRLSGLRTSEGLVNCAMDTLWPDLDARGMDEVIEFYKQRASSRFVGGHSISVIVEIVAALAEAELEDPVRVTMPTSAPPRALVAALDGLYAGRLRGCTTIAIEFAGEEHAWEEHAAPLRYGPSRGARKEIRLVGGSPWGSPMCEGEISAVLAPGQEPPSFTLPGWLSHGSANVHACTATAEGIVRGIREAQRFAAAHPPLLGRDRRAGCLAVPRAPEIAKAHAGALDREEMGDRFVDKTLQWAAAAGLLLPHAAWQRAAENYALTAFFIHHRIRTEWDEAGALWEERADLTARYMLIVAVGDEAVFDRDLDGETQEQRWLRLEASSRFLLHALETEGPLPRVPRVPGAELLVVIAREWRALLDRYQRSCLPAVSASFRFGLRDLYAASLAEHRPSVAARLLARGGEDPARVSAIEDRIAATPPFVAARARALVGAALGGDILATNELSALLYLTEVASAVGAGLLFRTAALAAPSASVPRGSLSLLEETSLLLDYQFRLANDLSGFLKEPSGDRDSKENACTILVPQAASGVARAAAIVQALAACRRLSAWIGGEVNGRADRLAAAWPSMGAVVQRGVFVGRRVYEVGHYTTLSRAAMSAIFDEAEAALTAHGDKAGRRTACISRSASASFAAPPPVQSA